MKNLFLILFIIWGANSFAQTTIYYNSSGEITLTELATQFRICHVNLTQQTFTGVVKDFKMDSIQFMEITYDNNGIKNGKFYYKDNNIFLSGYFKNDHEIGDIKVIRHHTSGSDSSYINSLPDSLVNLIIKK